MNKLILLLLLLFFISKLEAQDFFSDSLGKVAANARSDSDKVNAYDIIEFRIQVLSLREDAHKEVKRGRTYIC